MKQLFFNGINIMRLSVAWMLIGIGVVILIVVGLPCIGLYETCKWLFRDILHLDRGDGHKVITRPMNVTDEEFAATLQKELLPKKDRECGC